MKPFLDYGWQPQVMAVDGRQKSILAGRVEIYDVVADPGETARPGGAARRCRAAAPPALRDYPVPVARGGAAAGRPSTRRRGGTLASLGLRQRRRGAGRAEGRAAAGRHGPAVRR